MENIYIENIKRAPKGHGRRSRICSIRVPEGVKSRLDIWKSSYENMCGKAVSYEQILLRWMDNIGCGNFDTEIRNAVIKDNRIHVLNSKKDFVSYLNRHGRFWECGNNASADIADDIVIEKSLLFLEFEDIPQLFSLYGRDKCWEIFNAKIKSQGDYYSNISFALENIFFKDYVGN